MGSRKRTRLRWIGVITILALTGGTWFAYAYFTDNSRLAALIKAQASRYLHDARLDVARVQLHAINGEIVVTQMAVWQVLDRRPFLALRVPWLRVKHNPRSLAKGKFVPSEIVIAQPTIRLHRAADGSLNIEHLLSKKLPRLKGSTYPSLIIEKGTVELVLGETSSAGVAILRDVSLKLTNAAAGKLAIEGSARGDSFDRIRIEGTLDPETGKLSLKGSVSRLVITETFRRRLSQRDQLYLEKSGLTGGELDLTLSKFEYDPNAATKVHYEASARLQAGVINCAKAPFPLSEVSAEVSIKDDELTLHRAEGFNGPTTVRVWGGCHLGDLNTTKFDINIQAIYLEFDRRLRSWTPEQFGKLWDEYQPRGRVNVAVHAVRERAGGPVGVGARVDCQDVSLRYHMFPYTVEHVRGTLISEDNKISIAMETPLVGGKPITARGTIENPGPNAHVLINFHADSMPIDKQLLDALPEVARRAVDQFQPTGAVAADAVLERLPPTPADPGGKVTVKASLDLDGRCAIRWAGLPYPVTNLTGRLMIEPDSWSFHEMKGKNGQAEIAGDGWVKKVSGDRLAGEIHLKARTLPFDQQLHDALPAAWQITWKQLNPIGSSRLDARIRFDPQNQDTHIQIVPEKDTRVRLEVHRPPSPGDPGGKIVFPAMEDIHGLFVFHNGTVTMNDVRFQFHNADVRFATGTVLVENSGKFDLRLQNLTVADFRLDAGIRQLMPKLMAQFALRLDDGKTLALRSKSLRIGWSGKLAESAWCSWNNALVVFNGNTISTGLPLEHMQGQIDHVDGVFSGERLWTKGILRLASVSLLGQQVTNLAGEVEVTREKAWFKNLKGGLLGGLIEGAIEVSLDASPKYTAELAVSDAQLAQYAKTLPGRQSFRGLVSGRIGLSGVGNDIHTVQGNGEAHIREGDLGTLPGFLRLVKVINLSPATKTLFDSADVNFKINNGESYLNPILFRGDAFSLQGSGTLDPQTELDLQLRILFGRDAIHIPIVSSALREVSGQLLSIHVTGTPAFPQFKPDALHPVSSRLKRPSLRRDSRKIRN